MRYASKIEHERNEKSQRKNKNTQRKILKWFVLILIDVLSSHEREKE